MAISESEFSEFIAQEQGRLTGYLRRLCRGDLHKAEDLAQEAIVRMWMCIDTLRCPTLRYLYQTARTCLIDAHRIDNYKKRAFISVALEEAAHLTTADHQDSYVIRETVAEALAMMTAAEWLPVTLYAEGKSYHEIADILQLPLGTVKSRINSVRHAQPRTITPETDIRERIMEIARCAEYVSGPIASRRLNISVENAAYHLRLLERQGLLIRVKRTDKIKIREKSRVQWMLARTG